MIEKKETLFEKLSRMEETSRFSPAWTHVAAIRRRCPPTRPTWKKKKTLRDTLWFYLGAYGEDLSKWDEGPTLALQALVAR